MNDQGDEIQSAGPLNRLAANSTAIESVVERFPTVAADAEGKLSLVYMTREPEEKSWRLYSARLELDPKTGEPYLLPQEKASAALAEGLAPTPPLISTDGQRAFALTTTGEFMTITLANPR